MTGYLSNQDQEEIDELMRKYNQALEDNNPEAKKQARDEINSKVTKAIDTIHELLDTNSYERDENGNIIG